MRAWTSTSIILAGLAISAQVGPADAGPVVVKRQKGLDTCRKSERVPNPSQLLEKVQAGHVLSHSRPTFLNRRVPYWARPRIVRPRARARTGIESPVA